jgi:hypothetical protein
VLLDTDQGKTSVRSIMSLALFSGQLENHSNAFLDYLKGAPTENVSTRSGKHVFTWQEPLGIRPRGYGHEAAENVVVEHSEVCCLDMSLEDLSERLASIILNTYQVKSPVFGLTD